MVGFGDRIKGLCEDRPEWASYYVDYKSLKKIIKLIIAGEDVAEAEEGFALCLESELAKVESFFRLKEGNFASQLKQLARRVSSIEEGIAGGSECDTLVDMLKLLENNSDVAQLLKDLLSFASAIDDLREFVFANVQATIKITKKHDKHSRIVAREEYCNIMHGCLFYTSPLLGKLIRDTKMLVSTMMEKLGARAASPEEFRCFVCSHVFNNPLFLQCGHFACFRCIKATNLFKNNSCPVCLDDFKFDHENLQVYHLLKILQETRFTGPGPVGTSSDSAPKGASRDGSDDDCFMGSSPKPVARCTLASPCSQCSSSCPLSPNLIRGGLASRSFDLDPSAPFSLDTEASDQVKKRIFRKFGDHPFWQEQGRSSNESSPRQGDSSAKNIDKYDPFSSSLADILSPTALMRTSSAFVHDFDFEAYRRAMTMWKLATVVAIIGAIFGISLAAFPGIRHGVANLMGLEYVGDGHCRKGEWGYMGASECQMEDELGKLQEERKKWLMKTLDRIVQK